MDETTAPQGSENASVPANGKPAGPDACKGRGPICALALVLVAASLFAYSVMRKPARTMSVAALLPADVAMAMTLDFTRSPAKSSGYAVLMSIMKDLGVEKPEEELFKSVKQETQLDVDREVLPLLSGKAGLAVLAEMNGTAPEMALIVEARNPRNAAKLFDLVMKHLGEQGMRTVDADYSGVKYKIVDTNGPAAFGFGVVDGSLAVGYPASSFKLIVDCSKGGPSIAKDPNFSRLSRPDRSTVMSVYVSGPGYYKLMRPQLKSVPGNEEPGFAESMKHNLENYIAAVGEVSLTGRGLSCKVRGITRDPIPGGTQVPLAELAGMIPRNAAFAMSAKNLTKTWADLRKQFEANPSYKKQFDTTMKEANQTIGVDLFADILEKLTDIVVYYIPAKKITRAEFPGTLHMVAGVGNPDEMRGTVAKVLAAPKVKAVGIRQTFVAGQQVSVFVGQPNQPGIAFGQAKNKLVFAAGNQPEAAYVFALAAASGKGKTLSSAPGFRMVQEFLPTKGEFLVYGDLAAIVNIFRPDMDPAAQKKADSVLTKLNVFGGAGSSKDNDYEYGYVMPFSK